LTVQQTIAIMR